MLRYTVSVRSGALGEVDATFDDTKWLASVAQTEPVRISVWTPVGWFGFRVSCLSELRLLPTALGGLVKPNKRLTPSPACLEGSCEWRFVEYREWVQQAVLCLQDCREGAR